MLAMSYNYVQAHEAERTNFTSGLTILRQKIVNTVQSFLGNSTSKDLDRHQEMIRNYKELQNYLAQSNCKISVSLDELTQRSQLLQNMSSAEYKQQALSYSSFASQVFNEIQQLCKK